MLQRILCRACLPRAIFCLTVCLCFASTAASATPFTSPHGYTMNVPTGWHIYDNIVSSDETRIVADQPVAVGRKTAPPFLTMHSSRVDSRVTSEGLIKLNQTILSNFRERYPNLKVLSQSFSTLDGVRTLDCVFTVTATDSPLRVHDVLVFRRDVATTFMSVCPAQVYSQYAPAYAQMLSSVRWKS